jgi:hypothetical protein
MTRFTLTFEGNGGIHALRAILKQLLRRFGFRCVDLRELPPEDGND